MIVMTSSRHVRVNRGISWWALIIGLAVGLTAGLVYTWEIDPVIERNTAPWQLSTAAREDYVVAVALSYAQNQDILLAADRLRAVSPNRNIWEVVAEVACNRVKQGKTTTNSDIRVIRALEQLYRPQGGSGCADGLYPTPEPVTIVPSLPTVTPSPTLIPPPSKTPPAPGPTPTSAVVIMPTSTPLAGSFVLARVQSFCDPELAGVIEVRVYDARGLGVPGIPVTVTWSGNESDTFFTGLKPERETGYADFKMVAGRSYTVTIPGLTSNAPTVEAVPCQADANGQTVETITSYWVNFQARAN